MAHRSSRAASPSSTKVVFGVGVSEQPGPPDLRPLRRELSVSGRWRSDRKALGPGSVFGTSNHPRDIEVRTGTATPPTVAAALSDGGRPVSRESARSRGSRRSTDRLSPSFAAQARAQCNEMRWRKNKTSAALLPPSYPFLLLPTVLNAWT